MTGTNPRVAPDLVRHHAPKLADLTDDVLFADMWQRRTCPRATAA